MGSMVLEAQHPHRCAPGDDYDPFFVGEGRDGRLVFTFAPEGSIWQCECGRYWRSMECSGTGFARPRAWVGCSASFARRAMRRASK